MKSYSKRVLVVALLLLLFMGTLLWFKIFKYNSKKYEFYCFYVDSIPQAYNIRYFKKNMLYIEHIGFGGRLRHFDANMNFPNPDDDYFSYRRKSKKIRISDIKIKMLICRCVLVGENIGENNIMFNSICDTVFCGCPTDTVYYRVINDTLICDYPFDCIEYTIKNNCSKISKFLIDKESKLIIESKAIFEGSNSFVTLKRLVGVKDVRNSYFDSLYKSTTNEKDFIEF
ncbi:hypothetical protein [Tenuifilum thalassicum]|uniref:Uncharacterized protein n=1 Tax=Tenuifilum thalassicum TaxID=2590900 RepID=A0A7D3XDX5_9BACT|nr:hypothetical protein [Tenuifilum thalassicum]QKG79912.1 hypothetical protein FHG85_06430 [Tenuifilum thalassicum]